jgi:hypothetical protein
MNEVKDSFEIVNEHKEEVIAKLKAIYEEKESAEYIGASLTFKTKHIECVNLAFSCVDSFDEEIQFWMATLYRKHKKENCHYWKQAGELEALLADVLTEKHNNRTYGKEVGV